MERCYLLSAICYLLLAIGYWLFAQRNLSFVICICHALRWLLAKRALSDVLILNANVSPSKRASLVFVYENLNLATIEHF